MRTTHQYWGLMTGIRIKQSSSSQVEHAHKQGHKHKRVVTLAHRSVDRLHNELWRCMCHRRTAEHRAGYSHYQCCRHTLACHVTDTEVELLVADEEVKQVATHLLCRHHLAIDVNISTVREWWIILWQHTLLDIAGNLQFLFQGHLRGCRLLHKACQRSGAAFNDTMTQEIDEQQSNKENG